VSIANVAQLTIDLYVSSLKLERVGFLNDPSVMPVAGVFESAPENGVTVALEGKNAVGYHVLLTIFPYR
jgi:proteasome assembly chaperone 2